VHRDVKPANVMLARDGRVVLLDMGAASRRPETTRLAGGHPGSPAYMSPEQARGDPLDATTDLYALAVLLWQGLTGKLPPEGDPPGKWAAALGPALAADRSARYRDAGAFAAALP
jgi:serine/threonine protein kinase